MIAYIFAGLAFGSSLVSFLTLRRFINEVFQLRREFRDLKDQVSDDRLLQEVSRYE